MALLLANGGYAPQAEPAEHAPQAASAETEAARQQREDAEEFFLLPDTTKAEIEMNRMLINDDRVLPQLAQALRQPSPWLLMQLRGGTGPSFLDTLD